MRRRRQLSAVLIILVAAFTGCKRDPVIEASSVKLNLQTAVFQAEGGQAAVNVTSNVPWTASADASWMTVTPAAARSGVTAVTVTASANPGAARNASITFASSLKNAYAVLTISQEGGGGSSVTIPDREGATVKGRVSCDDKGLAGVAVSDGYEVTATDSDGFYWLASKKRCGYVFISIPGGYFPECDGSLPLFWQTLASPAEACETHSFALNQIKNDDHYTVVSTDPHLAARNNDLHYYDDRFIADVKETVDGFGGRPAYGIMLGDLTWDIYWTRFTLAEFREKAKSFPVPLFTLMGNHDYDMSVIGDDFKASQVYRSVMGPIWYSFNLGKAHYVVLDDIYYLNPGQNRSHKTYVDDDQLAWLAKDLALVSDKNAPLYVCMHCNGFNVSGVSEDGRMTVLPGFTASSQSYSLASAFNGFSNVFYLTGDTHCNTHIPASAMPSQASNITEHNIAAVCASWWWTDELSDNSICRDGSEGGYMVFADGGLGSGDGQPTWYYKGMNTGRTEQFRAYDMNSVKKYFSSSANAKKFLAKYPDREDYSSFPANSVLFNVFAWQRDWRVEAEEWPEGAKDDSKGSTKLKVIQKMAEDPLHTLSYDIPRTVTNGETTSSFTTIPTHHIFCVTASSPSTVVKITVTDSFGNAFTKIFPRPASFGE